MEPAMACEFGERNIKPARNDKTAITKKNAVMRAIGSLRFFDDMGIPFVYRIVLVYEKLCIWICEQVLPGCFPLNT
jgi:hypothetical protein